MSKIYEALENAQQESKMLEKTTVKVPQTLDAATPRQAAEMDLENEMIVLYQNIESQLPELDRKVILFLSAREGEGTSTIVREFARITAKKLGKLVFMLDAGRHGRRKCVFFHISPDCGLEEVSGATMKASGVSSPSEMDVEMSPSGPASGEDPIDFYSPRIADFWKSLKEKYDLVLIDASPLSVSPEGVEISRSVDGVVLVVEAENTRWQLVENLKEKIADRGGNILGIVLNKRRLYIPDAIYRKL